MKKILSMVLVIALVAGIAISGTMAYLTDRDNETNVFTVGDVAIELEGSFANGFELLPGKTYATKPLIKNVGKNDAWVWLTYAVPKKLASVVKISDSLGANWVKAANSHNFEADVKVTEDKIVKYAVTVLLYNTDTALAAEAKTTAAFETIGLDSSVDVTPEGDWYSVVGGTPTKLNWNTETDGAPFVFINAYAIQKDMFTTAEAALNAYKDQWDGLNGKYEIADEWDGTADTSWYNDTDTEFELTTAEQLAGLAELVNDGNTFEGKTIKLGCNVDLSGYNFEPIGGIDKDVAFQGTFDGQGNTISGLTQNGWDLGYEYGQQAGMGLFGWVGDATIKNVTIDEAEISMEAVVMGAVAGYAGGDCTFENITVSNTQIANYNWDTGGIVGQVYGTEEGQVYKNIVIDETTTISGHWGTWDVSAGGVIGRTANDTKVHLENITVAAKLDVYNDVVAAYQWYAYRYSGMLVGYTKTTETVGGRTVASAPHVTCENVTVIYGDWMNYTYCQFPNVKPQFVREQGGYSTDPYYSGRKWTAAVDINGNKVVDSNHAHDTDEKHAELLPFDQLFGGGQGVYGTATHPGVTVIYPASYTPGS